MTRVQTVGSIAYQQLQQARGASVLGRSSRGLFVRLDNAWVVFLAWHGPPGPLTLNLQGDGRLFQSCGAGERLEVSPAGLDFPPPAGLIPLDGARVWQAPEPDLRALLTPAVRRERLEAIVLEGRALRPGVGWSALLPGLPGDLQATPGLPAVARPAIKDLQTALKACQAGAATAALSRLIGLGNGLTPSGDDLALGLLLATSRWGEALLPDLDQAVLIEAAVRFARQATSDLSASLIEAAGLGQADPRLVAALDSLLTGQPGAAKVAAGLAEWGNSSGLDALLGMSLVL